MMTSNNERFLYRNLEESKRKSSNYRLLRTYGITTEIYDKMSEEQNHVCWICKNEPKKTRLNVDHRHVKNYKNLSKEEKSLEVRGLLCFRCNTALGGLEKSKESRKILIGIIAYFKVFKMKGED